METKICSKCKRELPATSEYFYRNKRCKGGLLTICQTCIKNSDIYERNKKWYESNKEKVKEWRKINKERVNEYHRKYFDNNKIARAMSNKKYKAKYWKTDKFKIENKIRNHIRRSANKRVVSNFTKEEWEECLIHFNHECAYCGSDYKIEQDHFIPLSKDGDYTRFNIIPACKPCNTSKNNRDFETWYPKQPFYLKEREQKILDYLGYNEAQRSTS